MKKRYALFIILFGLPLLDVFYSCCSCNDEIEEKQYANKEFYLKNIDNSGAEPVESLSENINKRAYGIRLTVNRASLSWMKRQSPQYLFTSSAYATSCDCPPEITYNHKEKAIDIKIITLQDFNIDKPANSDITEYFKKYKTYSDVNKVIEYLNYDFAYKLKETEYFDFLLMKSPTNIGITHQFKMTITFENKPAVELITVVNLM